MTSLNLYDLAEKLVVTAKRAGQVQLDIYATDFDVSYKDDDSPVSQADIASEKIILADLAKIAPQIPVLAEEAASAGDIPDLTTAQGGNLFFCVDPLDGTKEFIKKNDEFTVNIALIENGIPIFGLVYAPALHKIFVTIASNKAISGTLKTDDPDKALKDMGLTEIKTRQDIPQQGLSVVASRSHMSQETEDYLKNFKVADLKSAGSSLKLCMVASGDADLYPRFAPTMEWDTAAGHAVVLAAGGTVITQEGKPLKYNKTGYNKKNNPERPFLNPFFIVQSAAFSQTKAIVTAGAGRVLSQPLADLKKACIRLINTPLITDRHRSKRLKNFIQYSASLVVILVDQNDGLPRWVFQDITTAALLGARHIIVAPYHMDDESDPKQRLEDLSDALSAFVSTADIPAQVTCAPIDMPASSEKKHAYQSVNEAVQAALKQQQSHNEPDTAIDPDNPNQTSDQFGAYLAWYDDKQDMLPGRSYTLSLAGHEATATISALKYQLNLMDGSQDAAKTIAGGKIAFCNLSLNKPIGFEPFKNDQTLGQFTLKDKNTGQDMAWGRIEYSLARATNLRWQSLEIDKAARAKTKQQKPFVLWFTGLSGCGKSTIASLLEKKLHGDDKHTYVLDGDNVRHGLCRDLGFVDTDRVENMRRVSETAKLFIDAGLIVLVSFISPFRSERDMARSLFEDHEFFEVFVDTPLEICEQRDIKGLYKKARAGLVPNFTGISSPYEAPKNADFHLDGNNASAEEMTDILHKQLQDKGLI